MPRPGPGPSTTAGAPRTAMPPPSGNRSPAVRSGSDHAVASKSLTTYTDLKPKARHNSVASATQELLVSTPRPPSTGPATASTARAMPGLPWRTRNAAMASETPGYSATSTWSTGPSTPSLTSANLALVPPMSPNRTFSPDVAISSLLPQPLYSATASS